MFVSGVRMDPSEMHLLSIRSQRQLLYCCILYSVPFANPAQIIIGYWQKPRSRWYIRVSVYFRYCLKCLLKMQGLPLSRKFCSFLVNFTVKWIYCMYEPYEPFAKHMQNLQLTRVSTDFVSSLLDRAAHAIRIAPGHVVRNAWRDLFVRQWLEPRIYWKQACHTQYQELSALLHGGCLCSGPGGSESFLK